jgi:hypothetical protein
MIFEDLQEAFDIRLIQFGTSNGIVVGLENISLKTSTDTPYLAGFLLLAPTEQADLGVNEFRQGVYQVDINYASHLGSAPLNKMADLINAAFFAGLTLSRNEICAHIESVDLGPLIVNNGWATKPLSINFNAYTARI